MTPGPAVRVHAPGEIVPSASRPRRPAAVPRLETARMPAPSLRRLAAPALAALLAFAPAACDLDAHDPNAPQLQQQWIALDGTAPPAGSPPNVEVDAGAALVQVIGEFVRTCTEGNLRVTHALDGTTLTFRAIFTPAASCASSTPTRQYLRYFGYLFNVPAGTYQVRVLHENDDLAGATGIVHEETVAVF